MADKCNKDCLCLKCAKSCMRACRNCNHIMNMCVRNCKEYTEDCAQMSISDYLNEVGRMSGKR